MFIILSNITRINFRSRKKAKSILVMYTKVVYIVTKCQEKGARNVKKMSFCDKMAKKK